MGWKVWSLGFQGSGLLKTTSGFAILHQPSSLILPKFGPYPPVVNPQECKPNDASTFSPKSLNVLVINLQSYALSWLLPRAWPPQPENYELSQLSAMSSQYRSGSPRHKEILQTEIPVSHRHVRILIPASCVADKTGGHHRV